MGANPRIYSLTHANRGMIFTVRTLTDNLLEIFSGNLLSSLGAPFQRVGISIQDGTVAN